MSASVDAIEDYLDEIELDRFYASQLDRLAHALLSKASVVEKACKKAHTAESHCHLADELEKDREWSFRIVEPSFIDADELSRQGLRCFDYYLWVRMASRSTKSAPLDEQRGNCHALVKVLVLYSAWSA